MADRNALFGAGFAYPGIIDDHSGSWATATGLDSIRASLHRLFSTAPGEFAWNPAYGCGLKNMVFENDDDVFRAICETLIRQAVGLWEPRIAQVLAVNISRDDLVAPNTLNIATFFLPIKSQVTTNFVYPFLLPPSAA